MHTHSSAHSIVNAYSGLVSDYALGTTETEYSKSLLTKSVTQLESASFRMGKHVASHVDPRWGLCCHVGTLSVHIDMKMSVSAMCSLERKDGEQVKHA